MSTPSTFGSVTRVEPRWSELESIVPAVLLPTAADEIDGVAPARVVTPENVEQVSSVLAWANDHDIRTIARGGGTKLNWGNLPGEIDLVLSLEKFHKVVEHAWEDMTVTVQAGTRVSALQAALSQHRQRLPLDTLWPDRATIGGAIATNDSGTLRIRYGSIRDLILGATVVLANGTVARSGGRVVKNVAGYDLPKLFTGSFGTLGVIVEVTLRTYPLPHAVRSISFCFDTAADANRYMLAIADTTLVPVGMQMRVRNGEPAVVDLCFEGLEEGIAAQVNCATELASGAPSQETAQKAWTTRETLWAGDAPRIVAKFSVLPSKIAECAEVIRAHFPRHQIIAQSIGLSLFGADAGDMDTLHASLLALRAAVYRIGGTLTILHAPREIKQCIDVFGQSSSGQQLMVRIKQRFDPRGILNPGRFLGGI